MSAAPRMVQKSPSIRFRIIDGEAVVFNQDEGEILVLDEVGSRILDLVGEGRKVGSLVNLLIEEFEVERSTLEGDVASFIDELLEAGILVAADTP